jgi:hypothetical protein
MNRLTLARLEIETREGKVMISANTKSVMDRAKRIYAERLQNSLEAEHRNRFVAIEPESGEYFLADTLDAAVRDARTKHPDRISHVLRIGHPAALHIGGASL